jgi:hypothetical protein
MSLRSKLVLATAGVVFSVAAPTMGVVLYQTNFDTFNLGAANGQQGWAVDSLTPNNYTIVNGGPSGSGRAFKAAASPTSNGGGWAYYDPFNFNPITSAQQILTIEWDQFVDGTATKAGGYGVDIFDSNFTFVTRVQLAGSDNSVRAENALAGFVSTGVTVPDNTWANFRLVMDWTTNRYDLFVNNVIAANNFNFTPGTGIVEDVDFRQNQQNPANNFALFDNLRISAEELIPDPPEWALNANGVWNSSNNWSTNVIPNGPEAIAVLGTVITAPRSITLDAVTTVDQLKITSPVSYNLVGLPSFSGPGFIFGGAEPLGLEVTAGTHEMTTPAGVQKDMEVKIDSGATFRFRNTFDTAGRTITKTGGGTLRIRQVRGAGLVINAGTVETTGGGTFTGTSKVGSLTIASGGLLNIANQVFVVDYLPGPSPINTIRQYIEQQRIADTLITLGYVGVGYAEASELGLTAIDDVSLDSTSIVITSAIFGDTDLNNTVAFADLLSLAQNYDAAGNWKQGDFDYNGQVQFADLLLLAQNYGATLLSDGSVVVDPTQASQFDSHWQLARSMVPEPATLALLAMPALLLRRRRD